MIAAAAGMQAVYELVFLGDGRGVLEEGPAPVRRLQAARTLPEYLEASSSSRERSILLRFEVVVRSAFAALETEPNSAQLRTYSSCKRVIYVPPTAIFENYTPKTLEFQCFFTKQSSGLYSFHH